MHGIMEIRVVQTPTPTKLIEHINRKIKAIRQKPSRAL
jgi:hypothetical protein